jgi:HAD superfamily hydrolase (TIGR01509 family)
MRPILLFDVMDTLVYNPFNREIPNFFGCEKAELLAQKHPTAWSRFETGEIEESEYLRICFADGRDFDHARFLDVVTRAYRWIDGSEELLRRLSLQGFEIHALSNYPVWYRSIEAKLRLSRYLSWTFVSCLTGVRKPSSTAYLGAARKLARPVESCLLIDDSLVNCRAAQKLCMPSIHFRDVSQLCEDLRQCGLMS